MQRRSRRDACSSLGRGAEQHHGQHDRGPGDCGLNACSHVAHSFHRRTDIERRYRSLVSTSCIALRSIACERTRDEFPDWHSRRDRNARRVSALARVSMLRDVVARPRRDEIRRRRGWTEPPVVSR